MKPHTPGLPSGRYNTPKKDKVTAATITINGMIRLAQTDLGPPKSDAPSSDILGHSLNELQGMAL